MKTRRNIIIVAIVVLVAAFVYYRFQVNRNERAGEAIGGLNLAVSKEVSAIATYKVPEGEDKTKFILSLNKRGVIVGVKSADLTGDEEVQGHLDKFSEKLLLVIKGKKLSELESVDRVGTSSLTTAAFNGALNELKSQI